MSSDVRHLGSGVVLFKKRLPLPGGTFFEKIDSLAEKALNDNYTVVKDENGDPTYAVNRSGHRFNIEDIEKNCVRISAFDESTMPFVKETEQVFYQCLLEYVEMFPLILPCLWWKTEGHLLKYSEGSSLGLHCDNDVNYKPGYEPDFQLGLRHVLAAITYLNDDFDGGKMWFPYAAIRYTPEAGDVLLFPANFLCVHEVEEITRGTRYSYLEYFGQGSNDPERGISIREPNSDLHGGQVWMPDLFDDYVSHVKNKWGDTNGDLLLPAVRQYDSSGTKEELQ